VSILPKADQSLKRSCVSSLYLFFTGQLIFFSSPVFTQAVSFPPLWLLEVT